MLQPRDKQEKEESKKRRSMRVLPARLVQVLAGFCHRKRAGKLSEASEPRDLTQLTTQATGLRRAARNSIRNSVWCETFKMINAAKSNIKATDK
jgi:hypothetical protein